MTVLTGHVVCVSSVSLEEYRNLIASFEAYLTGNVERRV
jgi:hypothetical protein